MPRTELIYADHTTDAESVFDEGFNAYLAGKRRNPYSPGSLDAMEWQDGWEYAQREARNRRRHSRYHTR